MKQKLHRFLFFLIFSVLYSPLFCQSPVHPNVVLIMTDDQGFGDLGYYGNEQVRTPVLDDLARKSIRFSQFYVSPVCAPTRASLMTGRYSLRTGIRDTYNGGAIMSPGEVTIAEMLKQANYRTGIFGKWHLGDNYPSRPVDQGFDESVVHLSGGMGQVGDMTTYFKGDSSYFDPVLWHNGKQEEFEGYCSDIFTDQAIDFIEKNHDSPFFCYLAFNAPHTPLQVPDTYAKMYADIDPANQLASNNPFNINMSEQDREDARRVYAMVSNIDENIGKLFEKLDSLGIRENTIVVFLTDNGPQQQRYVAGMRGRKGSVYRGGIRVPFFFSYPSMFDGNRDIDVNAAHIDLMPTLSELCHAGTPGNVQLDGKSLVPLIRGENPEWEQRALFFYWTRRYPELYNNIAIQKGAYKLVVQADYDASLEDFELYHIPKDPSEKFNLVLDKPDVAKELKSELDHIYHELIQSENLVHAPKIHIGMNAENPLYLNRNDAGGERGIWSQEEVFGKWDVEIEEGRYHFEFRFIRPVKGNGRMYLEVNTHVFQQINSSTTDLIEMQNVSLPKLKGEIIPFYMTEGKRIMPFWVKVEKVD